MKHILLFICSFFVITAFVYAQDDCALPVISATTGGGSYCLDEEVTITITGELNDATTWQWYTGSCGGDIIQGQSGTSITVKVDKTVSYFVRGIGGCVETTAVCTEITVILDDEPPVPTCPEDMVVTTELDKCEAVVTFEKPTGTDNCGGEVIVEQVEGLESGDVFPLGVTLQKYVFTDIQGNTSECMFTITVEDSQNPVITCPDNIEVNNDEGECGAIVTYEAPTATDNCSVESVELTSGLGSGSFFPVGTSIETYTAKDASGNTATCDISITVFDTELPVITLSKTKTTKWPPNHKHFELNIDEYIESVTDNCPGVSIEDVIVRSVSSDEENNGKGDGNTYDDILIDSDCKTIHLLAERQGGGDGRVYTINLAVMDAHRNIGIAEIKAEISHDQGKKKSVIDSGPVYIVTGCDFEEEEVTQPINEVGTDENMSKTSTNISAIETYPNPFTNGFKIHFSPIENDKIEIELFTFSGKKVKELFSGDVRANKIYTWDFDFNQLSNELYLIVIKGEKTHTVKKIMHNR